MVDLVNLTEQHTSLPFISTSPEPQAEGFWGGGPLSPYSSNPTPACYREVQREKYRRAEDGVTVR